MSSRQELSKLLTEAAKYYASKDYEKSTNYYSEVNELYYALNQENKADYLFLYGKSLYQLALSSSDVFGGSAAATADSETEDQEKDTEKKQADSALYQFNEVLAEEESGGEEEEEEEEGEEEEEEEENVCKKKEEEQDDSEGDNDYDNQTDFEAAWEILELARSLYEKEAKESSSDRETLEKLSETYDILGEISLESESFTQAKEDFQRCLELRLEIFSKEDPTHRMIIEAYYKLSLALEFDPLETKACKDNLTKVIELLTQRMHKGMKDEGDEDLLAELRLKLRELENTVDPLEKFKQDNIGMIREILGGDSSASPQTAPAKVNDLTSMVKKRKPKTKHSEPEKKQKRDLN